VLIQLDSIQDEVRFEVNLIEGCLSDNFLFEFEFKIDGVDERFCCLNKLDLL
jgi:hypothetical protein